MLSGVLSIALTIIIILAAIWIILWAIKLFVAIPGKMEQIIWVIALILCLIKLAQWAGF